MSGRRGAKPMIEAAGMTSQRMRRSERKDVGGGRKAVRSVSQVGHAEHTTRKPVEHVKNTVGVVKCTL